MKTFGRASAQQVLEIGRRHGVTSLSVFGSWARGEATETSDLDLLVALEPGRTLWDLSRLKDDLELAMGIPVDFVTEGGLSPYIRERVLSEAVAV